MRMMDNVFKEMLAEVPAEYRDGKLLLKLDNTLNGKGVMLYELLF